MGIPSQPMQLGTRAGPAVQRPHVSTTFGPPTMPAQSVHVRLRPWQTPQKSRSASMPLHTWHASSALPLPKQTPQSSFSKFGRAPVEPATHDPHSSMNAKPPQSPLQSGP
eukprot:Amastigsp_a342151_11.p6 type:complete len:110 gc:universal Amastigsp_a342151_11:1018-689(-)